MLRRVLRGVDAPTVAAFVGTTNVITTLAAFGLGKRIIISERNDPVRQSLGRPWDLLRRSTYKHADLVTANSRGALVAMRAYVPIDKLSLLPNPPPPGPTKEHDCGDRHAILGVGRLHPQKAYDVLLMAFGQLASDWDLVIAGEGEQRSELELLSKTLGIEKQVKFVGQVGDLEPYYATCGIFALSSRHEGSPNVLSEAMSFGLVPIISNASPGPLEYVTDNESGLVVPTDDPVALAQALQRLIEDPELRSRLAAAAKKRINNEGFADILEVWGKTLGLEPSKERSSLTN